MNEDMRVALASALRLVAEQLPSEPQWAGRMLGGIDDSTLVAFFRDLRDRTPDPKERIRLGLRVATSAIAEEGDWVILAHIFSNEGRPADAAYWMAKVVQFNPRDVYYQFLGSMYERLGEMEAALRNINHGLTISPQSADLLFDRSRVLMRVRSAFKADGTVAQRLENVQTIVTGLKGGGFDIFLFMNIFWQLLIYALLNLIGGRHSEPRRC